MLDHGAIAQGNATPEAILADELHWQARFGDRSAHHFEGFRLSACRARAWTPSFVAGLDLERCVGCQVVLGLISEAEARALFGDR